MLVKTTKKDGHTRSVLAYDAREGLKVVDKPGVQEVPDGNPRVERLIQEGVLEKSSKDTEAKTDENADNATAAAANAGAAKGDADAGDKPQGRKK